MVMKKGSRGNDTLNGTASVDHIYGFLGNDTIDGKAGNDQLVGGGGNDKIYGGTGNDWLYGGQGADKLYGGAGNDFIFSAGEFLNPYGASDKSADQIDAGAGDDYVSIDKNDIALGGAGTDMLFFSTEDQGSGESISLNFSNIGAKTAKSIAATGTSYAATKAGQFENVDLYISNATIGSKIIGSNGDDLLQMTLDSSQLLTGKGVSIYGGKGNDEIEGSGAGDTLNGGKGNDKVDGGFGGADSLTGGAGYDNFVINVNSFLSAANADMILDFSRVDDILGISVSGDDIDFGNETNLLRSGATTPVSNTAAGVAQFLYNTSTGVLSVDINGVTSGGVTALATFANKVHLTAQDFSIEYL
jgi:Ca2+-binding RTX toxin-like protein